MIEQRHHLLSCPVSKIEPHLLKKHLSISHFKIYLKLCSFSSSVNMNLDFVAGLGIKVQIAGM